MKFRNTLQKLKNLYSKRGSNIFTNLIFFVCGFALSYTCSQFYFFKVDTSFNFVESIISIVTIIVGIYIARNIQKNTNKSQNQYTYLIEKQNSTWECFISFSQQIETVNNIELRTITKSAKEFSQKLMPLNKVFKTFNISNDCLIKLENEFDSLENELVNNSTISNNIIDYTANKATVLMRIDSINSCFAETVVTLTDL